MARFYADEDFPHPVVEQLQSMGHDVLTVQAAGNANQKIPDRSVLDFATQDDRVILTMNRRDFIKLHQLKPFHAGIMVCTAPNNWEELALAIHHAIDANDTLPNQLIRINRPS